MFFSLVRSCKKSTTFSPRKHTKKYPKTVLDPKKVIFYVNLTNLQEMIDGLDDDDYQIFQIFSTKEKYKRKN
jgi:hypothetical protein